MHVITSREPLKIRGATIKPGERYLMNNTGAGSLLINRDLIRCQDGLCRPIYRLVKVAPFRQRLLQPHSDYNGRKIWLFRSGGYGDLLLMTPMIQRIKYLWSKSTVNVVTLPEYGRVLEGLNCSARTGFLPLSEISSEDAVIPFEGVIEDNPAAHGVHACELFALAAGLEKLPGEPKLFYRVSEDEALMAASRFPKPKGIPRIGIQVFSSSMVRSYPPKLVMAVLEALMKLPVKVFLFGSPDSVECDVPGVVNLTSVPDMDFRSSCAVLADCDVLIAPDSSLLHIAGALDIPTVALFGSFPSRLRVTGKRVKVLEPSSACSPCFHHESGSTKFPEGPCRLAGFCTVLATITPKAVVAACQELLANHYDQSKESHESTTIYSEGSL